MVPSPILGAPTTVVVALSSAAPNCSALDQGVDDSLLGHDSWLLRTGLGGVCLLEGVPPFDVEYLKKCLSPTGAHRDMMHYMAKVRSLTVLFFFCI